jgi:hypothetical protein
VARNALHCSLVPQKGEFGVSGNHSPDRVVEEAPAARGDVAPGDATRVGAPRGGAACDDSRALQEVCASPMAVAQGQGKTEGAAVDDACSLY